MQSKKNIIKRIVDIGMTVLLLCLMAYQVTGEMAHEWIGMGMTVLVILHHILNIKWYGALFKGKYNPYRIVVATINILLIAAFILTAFCGMSMSGYAVPFLYGMAKVSFVRRMHLSISHWAFLLMGLHLGLHLKVMLPKAKKKTEVKLPFSVVFSAPAGIGFWLFLRNNMPDYLFFKVPFAFLDYEKAGLLVFVENILILLFWVFTGYQLSVLLKKRKSKAGKKTDNPLLPVIYILAAIVIGFVLNMALNTAVPSEDTGSNSWGGSVREGWNDEKQISESATERKDISSAAPGGSIDAESAVQPSGIQDGFVLTANIIPYNL